VAGGFGVLGFDFTGLGSGEGEFTNTDFSSNVEDLALAAGWLRDHHEAPAVLIGHSLGGGAVLAAASRVPEAVAVATIGAPFDRAHVAKLFPAAVRNRIELDGEAQGELAGRTFRVRRQLFEDLTAQNLTHAIGSLRRALLVFHSPVDEIVDVDNARRIFDAARHPCQLHLPRRRRPPPDPPLRRRPSEPAADTGDEGGPVPLARRCSHHPGGRQKGESAGARAGPDRQVSHPG
jgi:fermentation-respiration switch protein FrsA (DUF1100 family)